MLTHSFNSMSIGFIGGGNMARSLVGGLLARGLPPSKVTVADPQSAQRDLLAKMQIAATGDNAVAARSQVVVLAVKPQQLHAVATALTPHLAHRPLMISVAAGIRARDLQRWLGGVPVVRAMPNQPALNGCGVSGLFATSDVSADGRKTAEAIMSAVGPAFWVDDEAQMDAVTAVSGSGPAYFFLLIEMLEAAGTKLGLSSEVSRRLAIETAYGAGVMARGASVPPSTLREQVTSKGGTTEAALKHLEAAQVRAMFTEAVAAAARRSAEMAAQFGEQG